MIGQTLITLARVDSTNSYLEQIYHTEKVRNGTIILATEQYSGKGQDDKQWYSEPGKNLTFSLLVQPGFLHPSAQFQLNMAVALAVSDTVASFLPPASGVSIKWPNDIYIKHRKVSGILIKHFISGLSIDASIIGIGININQEDFPAHLPNPVSLFQASGKFTLHGDVLNAFISKMQYWYERLEHEDSPEIQHKYLDNLYRLGEVASYEIYGEKCSARITGIDEYGKLQLIRKDGKTYSCDLNEIRFL